MQPPLENDIIAQKVLKLPRPVLKGLHETEARMFVKMCMRMDVCQRQVEREMYVYMLQPAQRAVLKKALDIIVTHYSNRDPVAVMFREADIHRLL